MRGTIQQAIVSVFIGAAVTLGFPAVGQGAAGLSVASAEEAPAPASCDWIGTSTTPLDDPPFSGDSHHASLRLMVEQDLSTAAVSHPGEVTVRVNYQSSGAFQQEGLDHLLPFGYEWRSRTGARLRISGYLNADQECVVSMLGSNSTEPGREGFVLPADVCPPAGPYVDRIAEQASRPLGCAVTGVVGGPDKRQSFEQGQMLLRSDWITLPPRSGAIYVLHGGPVASPAGGTWYGLLDTFQTSEPASVGLASPTDGLLEPRYGFGKAWRNSYGGPNGPLGWATQEEEQLSNTTWLVSWQQFERGIVIVMVDRPEHQARPSGYVLYHEERTWERISL